MHPRFTSRYVWALNQIGGEENSEMFHKFKKVEKILPAPNIFEFC